MESSPFLSNIDAGSPPSAVVAWAQSIGLPAELVGAWVWVFFDEKPSQSIREALKLAGFRFCRPNGTRRAGWAHRCGSDRGRRRPVKGCDARALYGAIPIGELEIDA